jgi:N utilization substance protein A
LGEGAKVGGSRSTVNKEFMIAINQVCHERQLSKEVVLQAVEAALVSAYKRNFGANQTIVAKIDQETGAAKVFIAKEVVAEVVDDKNEIPLEKARQYDAKVEIGGVVHIETTPPADFGRIAAQSAKQVILQRIREAERDSLYNSFAEREGEIINGTVQSIEPHQVTLSLGKVEAILPRSEQIPTERYSIGQRLRAYVSEVQKSSRGPTIVVSRTHRNMLRRLLELEVPEIFNGTVEIKSIAREAGYRSKVAVAALQEGVDPVGSCVGMRGVRIQSIVNELNGEKIDVVQWNPDVAMFIANGLSPAKVLNVTLEDADDGKTATVVVPDKQLSLAIGKEGQNARLAAKLTGWRIDIKSATEAAEEALRKVSQEEIMRQATAKDRDILVIAEAILKEKEGTTLSDGELQTLSRAIRAVDDAEATLEKERAIFGARPKEEVAPAAEEVPAPEGLAGEEQIDLLAQAEALLAAKEVSVEAEEVPAVEAEMEVAAEAEPVAAVEAAAPEVAEAVEVGQAPVEEAEEEAAPQVEVGPELELAPAVELEWVVEEEEEEDEGPGKKGKKKGAKGRKRELVFDENLGEVIARRKRKPGRQRGEWDEEY